MKYLSLEEAHSTKRILLIIALTLTMIGLIFLAYSARYVLLVAFIGVGLGVIFSPAVGWIQRRLRVPRGISGLILVLMIIGVITAATWGLATFVSGQIEQFISRVPQIQAGIQNQLNDLTDRFPFLQQQMKSANPARLQGQALSWALGGVQTGASAIAGFLIVLALSIYTAVNTRTYLEGVVSLFPAYFRPRAREVLQGSGQALRTWLGAQAITMALVAVVTGLGLLFIGVDYWLLFGLMAGVLEIVPFVGPVLAGVITVLVTLGTNPDQVMWVIGLFIVIQQLESNLISPLVMRGKVHIPEAPMIVLVLLLSHWFGLIGAFVAAPFLAVLHSIYRLAYLPAMDRKKIAPETAIGISRSSSPGAPPDPLPV